MAKKNNPQDEQAEKMLHNALGRYQEMLFKAANTPQSESVYQYRARFINAMTQSSRVVAETAYSVAKGLPSLQTPVSELLRSFGARYGGEEIKLTTYVRMTSALKKSVDEYRASLEQKILERERQGKVTTVADLRDIINEDLGAGEVTAVTYGSGAKMPVDKYAAMLARTTRAETENLSMITQALKEGIDLVECDIVSPTCDSCAVYQGRVYSISGKDSRYPSLYQTAFKRGYSIIHPNCRHSWSPYHAELYTDDEKREALERSNRSWMPDGNGRHFQQMEKAREAYAIGQQKQREWNAEILEYERMKAHYKGIGEEPPYKTLGAFRRAKRANAESYEAKKGVWSGKIAEANQDENNKPIPLNQESIKGAKYETKFAQSVPASTAHTVAVKSRQILRENNRKKEETAVCISAETGEVLFEQHSKTVTLDVDSTALNKQPADSVILVHNHPSGLSFSGQDLEFMGNNPQIHTMIAVNPDGKVFSLRTNCGKKVDRYIVSEYNRYINQGVSREDTLRDLAKKYGWEYKEV